MSAWLALLLGLATLVVGAELLVRSAAKLAGALGVRPMVIGLTVVAVGTSIPELAVGIEAVYRDAADLAIGNVAGTSIVNMLLILGLVALIRPVEIHTQTLRFELPVMVVASGLLLVLSLDGLLGRLDGLVFLAYGVFYTLAIMRMSRREGAAAAEAGSTAAAARPPLARTLPFELVRLAAGVGLTIVGADWLVDGAVALASALGVSDAIIGLTIVAVGTSAPELVTAIVSSFRGERDIAVGNLIGSNIYNVAVILGFTVLSAPAGVPVARELVRADLPVMLLVMLACVPVFITRRTMSRAEGGLFVGAYVVYLGLLIALRA